MENKKSDRIKDMLINVVTKETCITINTIINRYVDLVKEVYVMSSTNNKFYKLVDFLKPVTEVDPTEEEKLLMSSFDNGSEEQDRIRRIIER